MVVKGVLNNGEHTLIPVTAKVIHSAIWDYERFVLKDGRPLHMVNSLTAIGGPDRQLFFELRARVVSPRSFVRSQSLIAH